MGTITGFTAERMLVIEGGSIVAGEVVGGNLILTNRDGIDINAGSVAGPQGPPGPQGPAAISSIPGEIRMWPGSVLPALASFGRWVWADGAVYPTATYPIAAGHIATQWRTAHGQSDPGAGNFRVPDLRGVVPSGMDAMPGGSRVNRMTRSVAITIAGRTGEETHMITVAEMPSHDHTQTASNFIYHYTAGSDQGSYDISNGSGADRHFGYSNDIISPAGGGGAHENVQPTIFVPYIVCMDG